SEVGSCSACDGAPRRVVVSECVGPPGLEPGSVTGEGGRYAWGIRVSPALPVELRALGCPRPPRRGPRHPGGQGLSQARTSSRVLISFRCAARSTTQTWQ